MLLIAISLFFNCELMAENPIGINAYLGKWVSARDPSKTKYLISNVDGHIEIESLVKGQVVSNIKHNTHSLSFLTTSSEVNPLTGTPDSINVILIPDIRSNSNMFNVIFMESAKLQLTADTKIIDLMSRVKNGNNQIKGKTGISKEQSKHALENIYTKQWDFSELQCADAADKVTVQIVAMKNDVQAIFTHGANKAQVPAKIVDNTITLSIDSNEYDALKNTLTFLNGVNGRKYHLQLIPLCGNKNHLIFKAWYTESDRLISAYLMAPSICK